MSIVDRIRDARPEEALALEALQRRASDVWEEYRAQLAAHPDAIVAADKAIAQGRVRVAVDPEERQLGFSTVLPIESARCELDDLFVEPKRMRQGVGRSLVADLMARAHAAGADYIDKALIRKQSGSTRGSGSWLRAKRQLASEPARA